MRKKKNFISWIKNRYTNQLLSKSPPSIFLYVINHNSISYNTLDTGDMSVIFLCTWQIILCLPLHLSMDTIWDLCLYLNSFLSLLLPPAVLQLTLISTFPFTCDLNSSYRLFSDLKAGPSRPESLTGFPSILMSFIHNLYKSFDLSVFPAWRDQQIKALYDTLCHQICVCHLSFLVTWCYFYVIYLLGQYSCRKCETKW